MYFYLFFFHLGGESYIRIPSQRAFSHLKRPENLKHMDFECPPNLLVDVRGTVASIISLIERHITLVYRVPPLLIARLFRGGKTTVLKLVFEQLRLQQDTLPIIISLNDLVYVENGGVFETGGTECDCISVHRSGSYY